MKAPVTYTSGFIDPATAAVMFYRLWNELDWKRLPNVPRREHWTNTFNRPYTYGQGAGIRTYEPQESHEVVETIHDMVAERLGCVFEGRFQNGYENGKDALGWHADDDPKIDHSRPIVIVTLYDEFVSEDPSDRGKLTPGRMIWFRSQDPANSEIENLVLGQGSMAVMAAGMQQTHYHKIPKAGFTPRPRISLTFRGLFADD